jgi:uncharacterized RDD family membrane protein YckC
VQPSSTPQYSPDGQWYWDGHRWIPTAAAGQLAAASGVYVQYAGFWLRFVAYVIDAAVIFLGQVAVLIGFGIGGAALDAVVRSSNSSATGIASSVSTVLAYGVIIAGQWLYFSLQESSPRQATLGKRALGIKVVDLEGRRVSFARATARYFSKILSGLICDIGFIMAGFTERKQGLHDMIASTLVVRAKPVNAQQLAPSGSSSATSAVVLSVVTAILVLVLTSIVVIVILLTMGGQIKNVFSNVVVALNGG